MADPAIILQKGQVLLVQSSGSLGIMPMSKGFKIGNVIAVNDLSNNNLVGTYVLYQESDALSFMYGSTVYYIVQENNITGSEIAL